MFPLEVLAEQRTASVVSLIKGLGVAIEQIGELFADIGRNPETFQVFKTWKVCYYRLNFHQYMKMIRHKAIGQGIRDRLDMFLVLLKEVPVVLIFEKQVLISISVIIYMIVVTRKQLIHLYLAEVFRKDWRKSGIERKG